jgi:peptide/nickel transport system ATP-binding protein
MTALMELHGLERRFTKRPDVTARLLNLFGAKHRTRTVHAVSDIELTIVQGEVLAIVGESGCGKSTLGRMMAGILAPSGGRMVFRGQDVDTLPRAVRRDHARRIQMVFQDPMTALNPRRTVRDAIIEAPLVHGLVPRGPAAEALVAELLGNVGLDAEYAQRLPHELSGGQRQRVGIARALAVKPDLLVCDEATAALDVSIQAQVLNMFLDLKDAFALTYVFISHNLGAVRHVADRVAVMYLGRIVELADADALFATPAHPYTQALLREAPTLERRQDFQPIRGEVPSPLDPPSGCHFHPRCPFAIARCGIERPALRAWRGAGRVACHRAEEIVPARAEVSAAAR